MSQERRRLLFCERRAMSKCYLLLVLVLATACGRTDSAPIDADDHQTCLGYGFTPGTDGFVACKMRLQRSRLGATHIAQWPSASQGRSSVSSIAAAPRRAPGPSSV